LPTLPTRMTLLTEPAIHLSPYENWRRVSHARIAAPESRLVVSAHFRRTPENLERTLEAKRLGFRSSFVLSTHLRHQASPPPATFVHSLF
jgi:hypothetical protein